jgi:hypothetical protein
MDLNYFDLFVMAFLIFFGTEMPGEWLREAFSVKSPGFLFLHYRPIITKHPR